MILAARCGVDSVGSVYSYHLSLCSSCGPSSLGCLLSLGGWVDVYMYCEPILAPCVLLGGGGGAKQWRISVGWLVKRRSRRTVLGGRVDTLLGLRCWSWSMQKAFIVCYGVVLVFDLVLVAILPVVLVLVWVPGVLVMVVVVVLVPVRHPSRDPAGVVRVFVPYTHKVRADRGRDGDVRAGPGDWSWGRRRLLEMSCKG